MNDAHVSRRDFLRAGAAATAAAAAVPALGDDKKTDAKEKIELVPTRKLGKSGVEVSIISQGATFELPERHLNMMHSLGVRYIDTAKGYLHGKSEQSIAAWFEKTGHRKEYTLVTKDQPRSPAQFTQMLGERLEALKTDYIDLFFIHNLGKGESGGAACADWLTDKEWTAAADAMRKSGKARVLGFSSHVTPVELRTELLSKAAKGGWVDAIMVATSPTLVRENKEFNKALDACHKAGIGLISMKECRGGLDGIKDIFPSFREKGLSPYTAVLTAVWSDERFASICSAMDNVKKLRENVAAAKNFKPMNATELAEVDAMLRRHDRSFCAACDGSCQRAAGTQADLNTIARYVCYAEEGGQLREARERFAALPPEARNWTGADLAAATRACKCNLDFQRILAQAENILA